MGGKDNTFKNICQIDEMFWIFITKKVLNVLQSCTVIFTHYRVIHHIARQKNSLYHLPFVKYDTQICISIKKLSTHMFLITTDLWSLRF